MTGQAPWLDDTTRNEHVGLILAGGLARRMGGGDKPLAPLAGRTLLDHVVERLAPQVGTLVVNANDDPARFAGFGLPVVADTVEGRPGPLAGVLAGLRWLETHRPDARVLVTVAGDTPFLPRDLVARFAAALAGRDPGTIALAGHAGSTHQVVAAYPPALADALEDDLRSGAARKVMAWIERHPYVVVDFPDEGGIDPFFNINTPEDLAEAERALAGAVSQARR